MQTAFFTSRSFIVKRNFAIYSTRFECFFHSCIRFHRDIVFSVNYTSSSSPFVVSYPRWNVSLAKIAAFLENITVSTSGSRIWTKWFFLLCAQYIPVYYSPLNNCFITLPQIHSQHSISRNVRNSSLKNFNYFYYCESGAILIRTSLECN